MDTNTAKIISSSAEIAANTFTFWKCVLVFAALGVAFAMAYFALCWGKEKRRIDALAPSKTQLAITSIFLGLIMGVLCAVLSVHDLVIDIIAGTSTAILSVQIGEIMSHSLLSKKMASLERALDSKTTFDRVHSILDKMEAVQRVKQTCAEATPFIDEAVKTCFGILSTNLQRIAHGEIRIEDVSRELTTNKEFLEALPTKTICAVSYQDEDFWAKPEGIDFLESHKESISRGRVIERIFILSKSEMVDQESTIRTQRQINVLCRVVLEESLSEREREDFVLYDNKYVRFATIVPEGATASDKYATLTSDSEKVRAYIDKWNYLKSKSTPADEFYRHLSNPRNERLQGGNTPEIVNR